MKVEILQGSSYEVEPLVNISLESIKSMGCEVIKMDLSTGAGYNSTDTVVMITYATKDEIRESKLSTLLDDK